MESQNESEGEAGDAKMYQARANGMSKQLGSNPLSKFENSVIDMKYKSHAKGDDRVQSPTQKTLKEKRRDKAAQLLLDEQEK